MITIRGRVLMTSVLQRSEIAVAERACRLIGDRSAPRVLIGGLGLGFTLRAALDALPLDARVVVAELNPKVVEWCRGPAAALTADAASDPRVELFVGDVCDVIRAAASGSREPFDAIVLDLYEGPRDLPRGREDPLYGTTILTATRDALTPAGVYAVWGEEPNAAFEKRVRALGFTLTLTTAHGGGPRHAVYVATRP